MCLLVPAFHVAGLLCTCLLAWLCSPVAATSRQPQPTGPAKHHSMRVASHSTLLCPNNPAGAGGAGRPRSHHVSHRAGPRHPGGQQASWVGQLVFFGVACLREAPGVGCHHAQLHTHLCLCTYPAPHRASQLILGALPSLVMQGRQCRPGCAGLHQHHVRRRGGGRRPRGLCSSRPRRVQRAD